MAAHLNDIIAKTSEHREELGQVCSTKCQGREGHHGECCSIKGKDWIIGPIKDADAVLERLQKKYPGIRYEDVFIDWLEGVQRFGGRRHYWDEEYYPIFRVDPITERCVFYDEAARGCSIYDERSELCFKYFCKYLASQAPFCTDENCQSCA